MSCSQLFVIAAILSILFSCLLDIGVLGDKIEKKIYRDLYNFQPCVTLLNATHQIGCTSKRKGDVGVLHYIDSDEDFEWLLNKGKHAPYVPLFAAEYFTNEKLKQLVDADKVSGALVVYHNDKSRVIYPSKAFSPAYTCPNENFGLYKNDEKYRCSSNGEQSFVWNEFGSEMSYRQFDFPVFAMVNSGEIDMLVDCYRNHNKPVNGSNPSYPLCAVEMKSFMFAAKDTPTCMRKNEAPTFNPTGFCDPLGDYNVWGTLFPLVKKIEKDDVILATAKLDSTSFFHDIAPGADNDATGVVALLAASKALGDLKRLGQLSQPDVEKNEKHIMFTFFQGEVWDYIGSSRMVYDMMRGAFPCDNDCALPKVNISNIAYFLELNQVGFLDSGSLWAHSDPLSLLKTNVGPKVDIMYNLLSNFSDDVDLSIKNASNERAQPLPPASFQRFLSKKLNIPGLVVTDHKTSYTNKFYNSRFDDYHNLDFTSDNSTVVKQITSLATTVARTLYQLAYNKRNENITADKKVVGDLLACFLLTANCTSFKNVSTKANANVFAKQTQPFNRYVGTFAKHNAQYLPITRMTRLLLAYSTGLYNYANGTCKDNKPNYALHKMENDTICVNATVYVSPAQSPAFVLKDYASTEYSTWTESRWGTDNSIRMFLIADPTHEIVTLAVGIVLTLLSLLITVFMYTKADQLFTPDDCVLVINDLQ